VIEATDPRAAVIAGVAQVSHPEVDLDNPLDAIDVMSAAVAEALVDCGGRGVRAAVDTLAVAAGLFSFPDPAALVADIVGIATRCGRSEAGPGEARRTRETGRAGEAPDSRVRTVLTSWGGNTPIAFVGELAERIQRGEIDVAVFTGGETNATRRALRRRGESLPQRQAPDSTPELWGPPLRMGEGVVSERGGEHPRNNYAVLDSAIRAHRGETLDEARDRAAQLWAGFAAVAAANPHAADRSGPNAQQIRDPSLRNRMVSWPYTKAMCANNHVDQAAALVVMSAEAADRLGVPGEQRVYVHDTVNTVDTDSLLERPAIHHVPALELAARTVAERWGPPSGIDHIDLYGCFPSIVSHSIDLLGLPADRPLTVTGGLGFAGAPLNFAAGQSLVAMVQALRAEPGSRGMVQGNGGQAAKHAFGLYSATPPARPHECLRLDGREPSPAAADPNRSGPAVIDGVTVEYSPEGPERAVLIARFGDGRRAWANAFDPAILEAFTTVECVGTPGFVHAGGFRY